MMKRKGFTLVELMIGLLVSLLLIVAMGTFLGNVGYLFQEQKSLLKDRAELQRALAYITRDVMDVGYQVDEATGRMTVNGNAVYYMEIRDNGGAADLNTNFGYFKMTDSVDTIANAPAGTAFNYNLVTYQVNTNFNNPVTGAQTNVLMRNGEPFLLGLSEFTVGIGYDVDENGVIDELEWAYDPPTTAEAKDVLYSNASQLRITLAKESLDQDGNLVESVLTREILLRNRGGS